MWFPGKSEVGMNSEAGMKRANCKLVGRENSVRFAVREGPNSHEFGYVADRAAALELVD
jgi:hypothetical protein